MAVPRVFISSTYYDLRQARNNIGDFIKSLGYEPIMHERSGVAYTQNAPLEEDCYHELASCDIIICIIGNHFGSKSADNNLSITMNEIQTALKNKKKVYIFISNDVYIENRTYEQNKESGNFKSAYTDNIKIHEFISQLKNDVKIHVIEPFETTEQITTTLRLQFAGLFQNLLAREATMTDAKTAYDLQETADSIKAVVSSFKEQSSLFFDKFNSTIFTNNRVLYTLQQHLGLSHATFFARNLKALEELLYVLGFSRIEPQNEFDDLYKYVKNAPYSKTILTLSDELFDHNGEIKDIRNKDLLEEYILWEEEENEDDELPF